MKKSRFPLHYRGSSGPARLARSGWSGRWSSTEPTAAQIGG